MVLIVTPRLVLYPYGVYMKKDVGPLGCHLVQAGWSLSTPYMDGKDDVFWLQKSWRLAVMTMKVVRHSANPTQVAIIIHHYWL